MKNKLLKELIIIFSIINFNSHAQIVWPTNGAMSVGLSFGSYEYTHFALDQAFHTGIDIEGENGIVQVVAIDDGAIILINQEPAANQINIFFRLDASPNDVVMYGHCVEIPGKALKIGDHFAKGVAISDIQKHTIAHNVYDHCHFCYIKGEHWDGLTNFPNRIINPLLLPFENTALKDPGNTPCKFNDLIIRPYPIIGDYSIKNKNSFNCNSKPYIYGKVKLSKEIVDEMQYAKGDLTSDPHSNAWCLSNANDFSFRIQQSVGGVAAPNKISFQILDLANYPYTDQLTYTTAVHPLNYTDMTLLYDDLFVNNVNHTFRYVGGTTLKYNLTNIVGHGSDLYDYSWNTKVMHGFDYWEASNARCIEEAKFKDNHYIIKTTAEDLATRAPAETRDEVVIDNFKPYVKNVVVKAIRSSVIREIYKGEWRWDIGTSQLLLWQPNLSDRVINQYIPNLDDHVSIEVAFSEPMIASTLSLNIYSECLGHHLTTFYNATHTAPISLTPTSADKMHFTFSIPNSELSPSSHAQIQDIEILGTDETGNKLMSFSESNTIGRISASEIASRDNSGNWINDDFNFSYGDIVHHFSIEGCFDNFRLPSGATYDGAMSSSCIIPNFTVDNPNPLLNEQIHFTNLSSNSSNALFSWNFGDGVTDANESPYHIYSTPGIYDVKLTVNNTESITKNQYINVSGDGQPLIPLFHTNSISNTILAGEKLNFINTTSGGNGTISYQWTFDNGNGNAQPSNSTSINPSNILFTNEGTYDVILTATDNSVTRIKTLQITVSEGASTEPVSFTIQVNSDGSNSYEFNVQNLSGGVGSLMYDWDFGDGQGSNLLEPSHTYDLNYHLTHQLSSYTVTLTLNDALGNSESKTIQVSPVFTSGIFNNLDFTASPTFFAEDGNQPCGALVDFDVTLNTPNLFNTEFKWEVINQSDNINYGYSEYILGNWSPRFALAKGLYDVTVYARLGTQVITSSKKTSYISICEPDPNAFEITDFSLQQNCFPTYFNIQVSGGIGFSSDFIWPASSRYYDYLPFGINTHEDNIVDENIVPGTNLWYCVTSDFANPTGSPINISYTLHVFQNVLNNSNKYESISKRINCTLNQCATIAIGLLDKYVCKGGHINLGGNPTVSGGVNPITYEWEILSGGGSITNSNSANPIYNAPNLIQNISCSLKINDGSGKLFPLEIFTIHVYDLIADAGADIYTCINTYDNSLGKMTVQLSNLSYNWSPSVNLSCDNCPQPNFSPSLTGNYLYTLTITDVTGCLSQDQVQVSVSNTLPQISAPSDVYLSCAGSDINLIGSVSGNINQYDFSWTGGSAIGSNQSLSCTFHPFETTTYTYSVKDKVTGCSSSDKTTIFVNIYNSPIVGIGSEVIGICNGSLPDITATISNTINFTGIWYKDKIDPIHLFSGASTIKPEASNIDKDYYLVVKDLDTQCESMDKVKVRPDVISYIRSTPAYVCVDDHHNVNYPVTCNIFGGIGQRTYDWGINGRQTGAVPNNNTYIINGFGSGHRSEYFSCLVKDELGCTVDAKVQAVYYYNYTNAYLNSKDLIKINNENGKACSGNILTEWTCFDFIDPVKYVPSLSPFDNSWAQAHGWLIDPNPQSKIGHYLLRTVTGGQVQYGNHSYDNNCIIFLTPDQTYKVEANFNSPCGQIVYSKTIPTTAKQYRTNFIKVCGSGGAYSSTSSTIWLNIPNGFTTKAMTIKAGNIPQGCTLTSIDAGDSLFFQAGSEVILKEGFEALEGSIFKAEVTSCFMLQENRLPSEDYLNDIKVDSINNNILNERYLLEKFEVYPNPSEGVVNVSISLINKGKNELVLLNQLGEIVEVFNLSESKSIDFKINLYNENIKQGIYFLTLKTKDFIKSKKIVFIN